MRQSTADRRSLRGFTLTEVLVAIAIFAIIFVAALLVYDRSNRIFSDSMQASDLQQETRVAFETLVADLRMAGFDYNRDGAPIGANAFEQPDEQLEFIGDHAITFRSNLDYETDSANDNGRETDYEPGYTTTNEDDDYFPMVTTGNDEIVTYALVSDDGANDDEITFYADIAKPRKAYPGGSSETLVTISGVDLCDAGCNDPPYTLNRITLKDDGTAVFTPLASNIRSMEFEYYSDAQQAAASLVTPNGGAGQVTVSATSTTTTAAAIAARSLRASVQSIRMRLVGMNPNEDKNYQSPIEAALPVAEQVAMNYRQYDLETNIVPRNLGRSGMAEFPTTPPGAPEVTNVCQQGCGVIRVEWKAPEYGTVDSYGIIYDTDPNGPYGSVPISAGNLFGFVPGLDPNTTYYFKVVAKNSYGTERSDNYGGPIKPINPTKPDAPKIVSATGDGTVPAQNNDITISFNAPSTNVAFNGVAPVNSCNDPAGDIEALAESNGYQIKRSTTKDFDPDTQGTVIFDGAVAGATDLTVDSSGNATYVDKTAKLNCTPYYYRIRVKESCAAAAALNKSGDVNQAYSDWSNQVEGTSAATALPSAPTNVAITSTSVCIAGVCDVNILWDRVKTDVNGASILVDTYIVKRVFAPGGVESAATATTFTVTDTNPSGTGQMTWNNNTTADPTLAEPATGDVYHYYVAAQQCTTLTSAYSTPATKFPCAVITAGSPSPAPLDGDGQTSPYLIYGSTASIPMSASKAIASASIKVYPGSSTTPLGTGTVTHTPPSTNATFNFPLSTTQTYRVEMTMIDQQGCGTTVVRFVEGSTTNCCLIPFTEDNTVLTEALGVVTVTLKNQCTDILTLNQFKVRWQSQNNGFQRLTSVTYPDGTVDSFGGVPKGTTGGGTIISNATITVPAATAKTIAANGSYKITLKFENDGPDAKASNVDFCGIYPNPDNTAVNVTCSIAQAAGVCAF